MNELLLRQIDYWLLQAKFYMNRGEGFDHLVDDAFARAWGLMSELEARIAQMERTQSIPETTTGDEPRKKET